MVARQAPVSPEQGLPETAGSTSVSPVVIAVLGPTASGKSALGLALADRYGGEIINCDSTAVYRGFDIGTDKLPDAARRGIPHHLIDIADPTRFTRPRSMPAMLHASSARFMLVARSPILVGGTGFYYRALTRGLFPGPGCRRAFGSSRARRGPAGGRAPAPDAAARRPGLGCPNHAARPQAHRARARGLLLERPASDGTLREYGLAHCRLRGDGGWPAASSRADGRTGRAAESTISSPEAS